MVAILRGVRPSEAVAIGEVLYAEGFRVIEVPLNSPDPLSSIAGLAKCLPIDCLVGAGTVLSVSEVEQVKCAGGRLIVTPNSNPAVIRAAVEAGMAVIPGFATPTEAFAAIEAGATWLKLFPANSFGAGHLRAVKAVLPATVAILAVGGIDANNIRDWHTAGASGFGIASDLFTPGDSVADVAQKAARITKSLHVENQ